MGADDVRLRLSHREAGPGILQRHLRMLDSVADAGMAGLVPPVIKIEVMQQAAPCGGPAVQAQGPAQTPAGIAYQYTVVVAAYARAVLGQQAHGLYGGVRHQIVDTVEIVVFVAKLPHGVISFDRFLGTSIPVKSKNATEKRL